MSFDAEVSWLFIVIFFICFMVNDLDLCYFVVLSMNKGRIGLHLLSPGLVPGHHDDVPHGEHLAGKAIHVLSHDGGEGGPACTEYEERLINMTDERNIFFFFLC